MTNRLTVLVCGATGNQGNATAHALLAKGHRVRALVLDSTEPKATELRTLGAQIAVGSFEDRDSLVVACKGTESVFLMSTFYEDGPEAEFRQACAVADVAEACGVGHLVYSSVANLAPRWQIPHYDSKAKIEKHIAALRVPWTVLGPTFFMENLIEPRHLSSLRAGVLRLPIPAERIVAYTSAADIGKMAAAVIERRETVFGGRYAVAGDALSGPQVAACLTRATGSSVRYESLPLDTFRGVARSEGVCRMFEWIAAEGFGVDVPALHRQFPEVGWQSFSAWASRQDWETMLRRDVAAAEQP